MIAFSAVAGCVDGVPDDLPQGPEGHFTVLIKSVYDASVRPESSQRPQDRSVDLPDGHPAADLEVWFVRIEGGPGYAGERWEHDAPCPNGERPTGPWSDCEDFERKDAYVLPSPNQAGEHAKIKYPLDSDGRIVLHAPQPLKIAFKVDDRYTESLRDMAQDPDRCERWPQASSGHVDDQGGAERSGSSSFVVSDDARLTVHWFGVCPDRASS